MNDKETSRFGIEEGRHGFFTYHDLGVEPVSSVVVTIDNGTYCLYLDHYKDGSVEMVLFHLEEVVWQGGWTTDWDALEREADGPNT